MTTKQATIIASTFPTKRFIYTHTTAPTIDAHA
ncbi:hypothetical protein [Blautia wexlerae]